SRRRHTRWPRDWSSDVCSSDLITLREIPETTVLGALRVHKTMIDYRKQKIKEGVYTLRLGYQPSDGDHMGTAPNNEFCLPVPARSEERRVGKECRRGRWGTPWR